MLRACVIAVALITVAWGEAVGREDLASVVILSSGNSTPYREVMEGFQRYLEQHHPSAVGDVYTLSDGDRDKALDRLRRDPPLGAPDAREPAGKPGADGGPERAPRGGDDRGYGGDPPSPQRYGSQP